MNVTVSKLANNNLDPSQTKPDSKPLSPSKILRLINHKNASKQKYLASTNKKVNLTIYIYGNDLKINIDSPDILSVNKRSGGRTRVGGGTRNETTRFTRTSKRRLEFILRRNIAKMKVHITLTYPTDVIPPPEKVQRDRHCILMWLKRRNILYIWILEYTKKGVVHLHILVNRWVNIKEIKSIWYKIVGSENIKHLKAGVKVESIRSPRRLIEYLLKEEQKIPPAWYKHKGRFWGCSRELTMPDKVIRVTSPFRDTNRALRPARKFLESKSKPSTVRWLRHAFKFVVFNGAVLLDIILSRIKEVGPSCTIIETGVPPIFRNHLNEKAISTKGTWYRHIYHPN